MRIDPFLFIFPFLSFDMLQWKTIDTVFICGAFFIILFCLKSVEMQLCENWTKVKQKSGLSRADHPLLVGPLLIEIRVSLFRNTDEQYSDCNFLQNADFDRISINNGPTNSRWFPCGLMCDWSVSVMSLQWLSKCNLGRLPFVASAADSRNKSKQIWTAAAKHIVQHKELKKNNNKIKCMWS